MAQAPLQQNICNQKRVDAVVIFLTSHEQKSKIIRLGLFLKENNYQLPAKNEPQRSLKWTFIKTHWGEKQSVET